MNHLRHGAGSWLVLLVFVASGCTGKPAMVELEEARQAVANLRVAFTKAADASNRAVMSEADDSSRAYADEAETQKASVQKQSETLKPLLEDLRYPDESRRLDEFTQRFGEYRAIDDQILQLAVENSNVKAQQLSFGPVQQSAEAIRTALDLVAGESTLNGDWRIKALAASVLAAVREIQALEAPHIAEADDTAMGRIEAQMSAAETAARSSLKSLDQRVSGEARSQVVAAAAAFDRLVGLNAEVIALSRRNTNVRSLAMSLNEKGKATAACEQSLNALSEGLAAKTIGGTR